MIRLVDRACLDLRTRPGGEVLLRRVKRLLNAGVRVQVKSSLDEKETLTMPLPLNSQSEGSNVAAVLDYARRFSLSQSGCSTYADSEAETACQKWGCSAFIKWGVIHIHSE